MSPVVRFRFPIAQCLLTSCLLTSLVGCAVLPEPTGAQVQAQALGRTVIPPNWSATASAAQVDEGWLASFNDPVLTQLVHEALANNPDLHMAAARLEQANAQVDIAQARLKPSIGLLTRGGSKPVADMVPLLSGAMLRLSWEIDLWGGMRYGRNAARAARDATSAEYRYAQQSLAASVARAWFLASETRQQRELATEMVQSAQTLLQLTEQRKRVGAGSDSDVIAARIDLSSYQDAQQQIELAHRQALRALELLLGRYPGADHAASATLTPFPGPVPAGIPMDVLNRRPDMLAAERRVAAAFDKIGEARAAMLPTLSLSAGYGRLSNEVLETRDNLERRVSSITGTVAAPLYTGGALTGQVALRTAEQKEAVADYARRALIALGEVEGALNAERILGERERILNDAVLASREVTRLEQTAYRVGKSDLRAVNQRQLATGAAEVALLAVRRERLSRRVDLHLALGGSFDGRTAASEASDPMRPL
ncbi:efflux transporter outer membrane subunit [Montanilutibacter psychrotolerans]|uniref:Efflux transporter outer membrane subunit n=1 Tax=Montanilutibacter psychrotolerans TaxID=1327343 RepID=A0A3M8SX92_9GAMM|nr:efflux transporter outer membrane subunit [Lysobacter psychrotolerans]RNF83312.1 efflux transporter outer membrane subunit [Lysobacter psychrotolerans]